FNYYPDYWGNSCYSQRRSGKQYYAGRYCIAFLREKFVVWVARKRGGFCSEIVFSQNFLGKILPKNQRNMTN
uniref:hypothetical protein n=1 Tax=Microcoleus sp. TaxID=44472 RepID=UPI00403E8BDD